MDHQHEMISPSRTYVAQCFKLDYKGFYFRKFFLPEEYANDANTASWYFLNRIDFIACINGCITSEDFSNVLTVKE